MTGFVTYTKDPGFPPTDQDPAAQRTTIGGWVVDYVGTPPTLAQVQAQAAPTAAQFKAAVKAGLAVRIQNAVANNDDGIMALLAASGKTTAQIVAAINAL